MGKGGPGWDGAAEGRWGQAAVERDEQRYSGRGCEGQGRDVINSGRQDHEGNSGTDRGKQGQDMTDRDGRAQKRLSGRTEAGRQKQDMTVMDGNRNGRQGRIEESRGRKGRVVVDRGEIGREWAGCVEGGQAGNRAAGLPHPPGSPHRPREARRAVIKSCVRSSYLCVDFQS